MFGLRTFNDSTKAILDASAIGVQTVTHVGTTVVKITGTWDEVSIAKVNQDAKEVELYALPPMK
jgi:hypothetical protein